MAPLRLVPSIRRRCSDALQDFYLAKRAALLAPRTLEFYERSAGDFVRWLSENGDPPPEEVTARHVRAYLAQLKERGLSDATVHLHAQGVKSLCRFLHSEGYAPAPITFEMPKPAQTRMRLPTPDEFAALLAACDTPRDRALLLFLADTGARLGEAAALTWGDVDFDTGLVIIRRAKGRKTRSVVVGLATRRALLRYRRCVAHEPGHPLWRGKGGRALGRDGIRHALRRLSKKTGLRFSPHDLRRFFATASLRAGMSPVHVQALLGHTSLEMTRRYMILVEDDLRAAHEAHGPVDHLLARP